MLTKCRWMCAAGVALFLIGLMSPAPVFGQEGEGEETAAADTTRPSNPLWQSELVAKINGAQSAFSNWVEGGVNTLSFRGGLDGTFQRNEGVWRQVHEVRLGFGMLKQDTLALRKAEDLLRFSSALQYRGDGFFALFNPTIAIALRTQFAPGFNYDRDPLRLERPLPVKVSDFFSPATITQTVGLTYDPAPWFRQRVGIAGKQVVVAIPMLRPLYTVSPDGLARVELGVESRTQVDREVFENVRLRSSLGLFAAFNRPEMPDLMWENLITMRVNSWLVVSAELATLFDRDLSTRVQVKETVSLGVAVNLL
jgi:hypothetical protein